jgi:hypothetical protein
MHIKDYTNGKSRNTVKKLTALPGVGTAYVIQDLGASKNAYPGGATGWDEVKPRYATGQTLEDVLAHYASDGYDLLYRTASKCNTMRLWVRKRRAA